MNDETQSVKNAMVNLRLQVECEQVNVTAIMARVFDVRERLSLYGKYVDADVVAEAEALILRGKKKADDARQS